MPSRRRFLAGAGLAVAALASGCQDGGVADSGFTPDVEQTRRLGGAPSVSIERDPTTEYEYLDGGERVRYRSDSGDWRRLPFDEWGTRRAAARAAARVESVLTGQSLLVDGVSAFSGTVDLSDLDGATPGPSEAEFDRAVDVGPVVLHVHSYSREGELLVDPSVPFESVVDATPRAVTVRLSLRDREYAATLPCLCRRTWIREA